MGPSSKNNIPQSALVVDDMPAMRAIIRTVLRSFGVKQITEAGNGLQALQELQGSTRTVPKHVLDAPEVYLSPECKPVDLIILDWIMPEMTGIEFLKAIQKIDQLKTIPVIMLTAESQTANVIEAAEYGVMAYVVKPFSIDVLQAKIKRVFDI